MEGAREPGPHGAVSQPRDGRGAFKGLWRDRGEVRGGGPEAARGVGGQRGCGHRGRPWSLRCPRCAGSGYGQGGERRLRKGRRGLGGRTPGVKAARGAARIPGGATQHRRAARGGRGAALALSAVTRCVTSIPEPSGCRRRRRDLAALLVCQSRRGACRPLLGTSVPPPPPPPRASSPPSRFATLRISCSLFLGHLLLLGPLHSHRPCENRDLRQLPSGTYSAARRPGRAQ